MDFVVELRPSGELKRTPPDRYFSRLRRFLGCAVVPNVEFSLQTSQSAPSVTRETRVLHPRLQEIDEDRSYALSILV